MFINERTAPVLSKYEKKLVKFGLGDSNNENTLEFPYYIDILDPKDNDRLLERLYITEEEKDLALEYYGKQQELKLKRQQQALKDLELLKKNQEVVREFMRQAIDE